jgi:hypothetical protein
MVVPMAPEYWSKLAEELQARVRDAGKPTTRQFLREARKKYEQLAQSTDVPPPKSS